MTDTDYLTTNQERNLTMNTASATALTTPLQNRGKQPMEWDGTPPGDATKRNQRPETTVRNCLVDAGKVAK